MSVERGVRAQVARLVWPGNPHSFTLATLALEAARHADAGEDVAGLLRTTLGFLADCDPGAGDWLAEIRARRCRMLLDLHESHACRCGHGAGRAVRA